MQCFLNRMSVSKSRVNRRNFQEAKDTLFDRFCEWYETTAHESSATTPFGRWKNSKAIQMKKCTRSKQSIGNWKQNMETAYDSRRVRVDHLLCCSMKRQIKSYFKVHWRRCWIVVTLRKIWKASFSLAERLHNACKKAVIVKSSVLILATLL